MNSHPETIDNFRLHNWDDKERQVSFRFNQENLWVLFQWTHLISQKTPFAFIMIMMWYDIRPSLTEIGIPPRGSGH
jgi:hypothetical protein